MKSISVAMASYNGRRFIQQQLDSIVQQTRLPDELIVTDDASTDGTVECVEQFAATAPFPVHVYRNAEKLGFRGNFMRAISLCKSDLVALCDQDDVWNSNKLTVAAAAFETPDTVLFFHDAWLIDGDGARIGEADIFRLPPLNPALSVHSLNNPFGFSMVFDRALLQFTDLWERSVDSMQLNQRMAHDQWLFFLATVFGTIVFSDLRLTEYRQHGNNAYGWSAAKGLRENLRSRLPWLWNNGGRYKILAHLSRVRAEILADAKSRLSGIWRERAVAGEQAYLRYAEQFGLRGQLYSDAQILERVKLLLQLRRTGSYQAAGKWSFGRSALAKDVALGLVLKAFLIPPGDKG